MKKVVSITVLLLVLSLAFGGISVFAADAVSGATKPAEGTSAPAAPQAPAAKPAPVTTVSTANGTYTVVSGDSLSKIAVKFKMALNDLIALNTQIKNPSLINIGQIINIKSGAVASGKVKVYEGVGYKPVFRVGPGKDEKGVPVYSFNITMARATFDAQGKIIAAYLDGYEVATPNYDGASMPHFSGWPGIQGYNVTDHATAKVTGPSVNTEASATAEVNGWLTKRQRGDSYHMNPANEWYKQMDFYQKFFVGKTVAELEAWFAKNTTSAGRPIKANTTNAADLEKYNKLTAAEKAELADVVTGATMSIRDAHGDFLGALGEAYKNRVEVEISVK